MLKSQKYNFCHNSFLYNNLQSWKDKVLVIDTREPDLYARHAVSRSINLPFSKIKELIKCRQAKGPGLNDITIPELTKLMNSRDSDKFNQRKRNYCVLILSESSFPKDLILHIHKSTNPDDLLDFFSLPQSYVGDEFKKALEETSEKQSVATGLKIFDLMTQDKVRELFIHVDGAESFFNAYPYMDPAFHPSPMDFLRSPSLVASRLDITFNFPNDIFGNRLFLGTFNQASQEVIVNSLNITHIVNVTAECHNVHEEKGIKYLHIVILDEAHYSLATFFEEAFEFIEAALNESKNNKVLVHCALGKSRSATITIMFLMKKLGWKSAKALEFVKMKRRLVDPNYGFLKQLEDFEKTQCPV